MKSYLKLSTFVTGTALIASFALAPVFTFAKENEGNRGGKGDNEKKEQSRDIKKDDDRENKNDRGCWKAFGHFFAPGWIKHNGPLTVSEECHFPFGKKNRPGDNNGTTTPPVRVDTTAPVIGSIVSTTGTANVNVAWKTNEYSTSRVYYSTDSNVNASTTTFISKTTLDRNHVVSVTGLTASTTYYFIVESVDASGNISRSAAFSAMTGTPVITTDTTAPVITNAVAVVATTSVQLSWNTNENATTKAYYSTTTPVNTTSSSTAFLENTTLVSGHALTVTGLATSTAYYMVLESKDSSGNTTRTGEFNFTTTSGI